MGRRTKRAAVGAQAAPPREVKLEEIPLPLLPDDAAHAPAAPTAQDPAAAKTRPLGTIAQGAPAAPAPRGFTAREVEVAIDAAGGNLTAAGRLLAVAESKRTDGRPMRSVSKGLVSYWLKIYGLRDVASQLRRANKQPAHAGRPSKKKKG